MWFENWGLKSQKCSLTPTHTHIYSDLCGKQCSLIPISLLRSRNKYIKPHCRRSEWVRPPEWAQKKGSKIVCFEKALMVSLTRKKTPFASYTRSTTKSKISLQPHTITTITTTTVDHQFNPSSHSAVFILPKIAYCVRVMENENPMNSKNYPMKTERLYSNAA